MSVPTAPTSATSIFYLRAMGDVGASTLQFDRFRSLVLVGVPVEVAMTRICAPPHVQAFFARTMALANSGSTEEILSAFFYGSQHIIPATFIWLLYTPKIAWPLNTH